MRRFALFLLVAASLTALTSASAQQGTRPASGLQRLLDAELARFPAKAGVWVKHLTTGEEAGVRADEVFNSASVIKMPVLVLAFEMAERGQLSLSERVTLTAEDVRSGSGIFRHFDAGLQPTFRDVLHQMVMTS